MAKYFWFFCIISYLYCSIDVEVRGFRVQWKSPSYVDHIWAQDGHFDVGSVTEIPVFIPGFGNQTILTQNISRIKRDDATTTKKSEQSTLEPEEGNNMTTEPTIHVIWGVTKHEDGTQSYMKEGRRYGEGCLLAQDMVAIQHSTASVEEKWKKLTLDGCRLKDFLECLPENEQGAEAARADTKSGDIGTVGMHGKCKCMRGLSARGVFIKSHVKSFTKNFPSGRCYIPASFGIDSSCNHVIWMPYTEVDEGQGRLRRVIAPASTACVPHAQCTRSRKYIGNRCSCRKTSKIIYNKGTCGLAVKLDVKKYSILIITNLIILLLL